MAVNTSGEGARRNSRTGVRGVGKVLPEHQRAHNRALVLANLFHHGPASRADLARATELTRVTVSELVAELLNDHLVEELPVQRGGVGKPAIPIALRVGGRQIVAVDLSSDAEVRGAVMNLRGEVLERRAADDRDMVGDDFVELVVEFVADLLTAATAPVVGVGVGSPGIISPEGEVVAAPNRKWFNLPLAQTLRERLGVPVYVANDADVSAQGEYSFGNSSPAVMVVTFGQGVGAGLVVDGMRVHGFVGAAGEIGHVTVVEGPDIECACGRRRCLETLVSVPALRKTVGAVDPQVADAKLAGLGRTLGGVVAPVVAALNLKEVLLAGPKDLLDGMFRVYCEATIKDRTLPAGGTDFHVRMANLGKDIVLAGAAGLVLEAELGVS